MKRTTKETTIEEMTNRFIEIAREVAPLQDKIAEGSMEQITLSHTINLMMLKEAFPQAEFTLIQAIGAIKPMGLKTDCQNMIEQLRALGITPSTIIVDDTRKLITLAR